MSDNPKIDNVGFFIGMLGGAISGVAYTLAIVAIVGGNWHEGYREGYREGQIDALTGDAAYELCEQPDGGIKWVEITESEADHE